MQGCRDVAWVTSINSPESHAPLLWDYVVGAYLSVNETYIIVAFKWLDEDS